MQKSNWKRSSSIKPMRVSNNVLDLAKHDNLPRPSRSTERQNAKSKIPMRSSSTQQSGGKKPVGLQRSKSVMHLYAGDTPVTSGKSIYTPSQSGFGKITPGNSLSSKKFTKDIRNLQDKEYLKEAHVLVQSYFQEMCSDMLIGGSHIKPMTRKLFLDMLNHLFDALGIMVKGERLQFESTTFEKELPYWMKMLEYPGQVTKGWLQTVNVPHTWPNVLGLLCWLVKIVRMRALFDAEEGIGLQSEDPDVFWIAKAFDYSLEAYQHYANQNETLCDEIMEQEAQEYIQIFGCGDKIPKIQQEIDQLKQSIEEAEPLTEKEMYDTAKQRLLFAKQEHAKNTEDMKTIDSELGLQNAKNLDIQKKCTSLKIEIEDRKKEVRELEDIIASQDMTVEELQQVQQKCSHLNKGNSYLEKEAEAYQSLISKEEQTCAERRDKILQNNHTFNRNLIRAELLIPELKDLHIHMEPESQGFVTEMKRRIETLEVIHHKYVTKREEITKVVVEAERDNEISKQKLGRLTEAMNEMKRSNEGKKEEKEGRERALVEKEDNLKADAQQWSDKLKTTHEQIQQYRELKAQITDLHKRLDVLGQAEEYITEEYRTFWITVVDHYNDVPQLLEQFKKNIKEIDEHYEREEQKLLQELEGLF